MVSTTSTIEINGGAALPNPRIWIAAELDVNNGAGGYTVRFFWCTDGVTWAKLGDDVVGAAPTAVFNSGRAIELGSFNQGKGDVAADNFYRVRIFSDLARVTPIVDAEFQGSLAAVDGQTVTFPDRKGNVWMLGGDWTWGTGSALAPLGAD